jgi:uncharacterized protein YjbI with pentapeptide repeats
MKIYKFTNSSIIFLSFLLPSTVICQVNIDAFMPIKTNAKWQLVFTREDRKTYVDLNNITSDAGNRVVFVKQNTPSGNNEKSYYRKYSIICNNSEFAMLSEVSFSEIDLNGSSINYKDFIQSRKFEKANPGGAAIEYVNIACTGLNLDSAINATKTAPLTKANKNSSGELMPNLSITTGTPKSPGRPSGTYYEMMKIEGNSELTDRVNIQIFSDGQASVISNNASRFFMHKGNGVFVNDNIEIIVDESNKKISINGVVVNDVKITKKERDKPLEQMTFAEKLRFAPPLNKAESETELIAACASSASLFGRRKDWADKDDLSKAVFWGSCVDQSQVRNQSYFSYRKKWDALLSDKKYLDSLSYFYDRCTKDYSVTSVNNRDQLTGKIVQQCFGVNINH